MATTPEFRAMADGIAGAGVAVAIYDQALPDLPRANVAEAVAAHEGSGVAVVVGIGGGPAWTWPRR